MSFKSEDLCVILSTALILVNTTISLLYLSQEIELSHLDRMVYYRAGRAMEK